MRRQRRVCASKNAFFGKKASRQSGTCLTISNRRRMKQVAESKALRRECALVNHASPLPEKFGKTRH